MRGSVGRLTPEAAAAATEQSPLNREVVISIRLAAPTPGKIGPVLDELMSCLVDIAKILSGDSVKAEVSLPGYHQTFYGWESDLDDDPT